MEMWKKRENKKIMVNDIVNKNNLKIIPQYITKEITEKNLKLKIFQTQTCRQHLKLKCPNSDVFISIYVLEDCT